jgi:hypothetical protein
MEQASFEVVPSALTFGSSLVGVLIVCDTFMYDLPEEEKNAQKVDSNHWDITPPWI